MQPESVFDVSILEIKPGFIAFIAEGQSARSVFSSEPGGHRWQRVPPNERSGRRHTSTITVAVLDGSTPGADTGVSHQDLDWKVCRGSGAGGQHRNKTDSAVQLTHKPTGIMVRCESERSQHSNKELALSWLTAKLRHDRESKISSDTNSLRRQQIGSGMSGDKIRTVRVMDGIVTNNLTGRKMPLFKYLEGDFDQLLS